MEDAVGSDAVNHAERLNELLDGVEPLGAPLEEPVNAEIACDGGLDTAVAWLARETLHLRRESGPLGRG